MSFKPLIRRYPNCVMHLVSLFYLVAIVTLISFALFMGQKICEAKFGRGPVTHQAYSQDCRAGLDSCVSSDYSTTSSPRFTATSPTSLMRCTSTFPSTSNTRFTTLVKPTSGAIDALLASTNPSASKKGIAVLDHRQVQAPSTTVAAAPTASTDEEQHSKVSRKWKTAAMTLAAILGAVFLVGLVVLFGCGWLVLDLMDKD